MPQKNPEPIFSPDAHRQLFQLRAFDQRRIVDAIRRHLIEADPRSETRNQFALDPPPDCADHELRVGNLRVLYRVEEEEGILTVIVAVIGKKNRNRLIVEGEVFEL